MKKHPEIDGFILGHSGSAVNVHRVMTALGYDVFTDFTAVGFFWPGSHNNVEPRIATLEVNQDQLIQAILSNIDNLIEKNAGSEQQVLEYKLSVEGTEW